MTATKRLIYEVGTVLALLAVFALTLTVSRGVDARRLEAEVARLEAASVAASAAALAERDGWVLALTRSETRAVLHAFSAGIQSAVLSENGDAINVAVSELIRLPGIVFVHVVDPAGSVLASSDRKLVSTGQAGERAAWALGLTEMAVRDGELPGTTEAATPVPGVSGPVAFVWIGYDTRELAERTHPAPG